MTCPIRKEIHPTLPWHVGKIFHFALADGQIIPNPASLNVYQQSDCCNSEGV